jgi:hypothetical protein
MNDFAFDLSRFFVVKNHNNQIFQHKRLILFLNIYTALHSTHNVFKKNLKTCTFENEARETNQKIVFMLMVAVFFRLAMAHKNKINDIIHRMERKTRK